LGSGTLESVGNFADDRQSRTQFVEGCAAYLDATALLSALPNKICEICG
jgi:hypothetical protein